jgi:hypothetical protein
VSAPYTVHLHHHGKSQTFPCLTFSTALTVAKLANRDYPGCVEVMSDEAEGGYGDDGQTMHDGLTPAEREMVDEALDR